MNLLRLMVGLGLALALAVAVPDARATGGTTYYVGSLADDGAAAADCTSSTNTDCELRQALALGASGGDTIRFVAGLAGTVTLASGTLTTAVTVDIEGPGAATIAVDGGGAAGVFSNGEGADLTIAGLTVQNGSADLGGGVYNDGGTVTLSDDTFTGDSAFSGGGGVYSNGGTLTLSNDTFSNDDATSGDGGAVYSNGAATTLADDSFSSDSASRNGGAVYADGGTLSVTGDTFTGDDAANGGGVYTTGGTFTGDTFDSDSAARGGGVYVAGGTVELTGDTFTNDAATAGSGGAVYSDGAAITLSGDSLSNDTASGSGGAVYADGGTVDLSAVTLSEDQAASGGGVYSNGATATLANVTLFENSAGGGGGAIYNDGPMTLIDDTLAHDTAGSGGGGLYEGASGSASIANSILDSAGCSAAVGDGGYNVESGNTCGFGGTDVVNSSTIGLDASLSGSAPQTLAFTLPSSAFEEVPAGACTVETDARGALRPGVGGQTACDAGAYELQTASYTVTYNGTTSAGTAATSGAPPAGSAYVPGQTVAVHGNNGAQPLTLSGYAFVGWCTTDDAADPTSCSGTTYTAGETFTMPSSDVTLYSLWTSSAPPAITSADQASFTVGAPGTFAVTATGLPTPALSEVGALPSGVTFTDNGDGTATLSGTPNAGAGGTYPFTISAANGVQPDASQDFTLSVLEAPAITSPDHATFGAGEAGTFTVQTTGTPLATVSETGALPTGLTFVPSGDGTATLSGTPTAAGSYPLTLGAANGVAPDASQSFTLTVADASTLPHVTAFSPAAGVAGASVILKGTNLLAVTEIDFTGAAAPSAIGSKTAAKLVVPVPPDARFGPLVVHTSFGSFTTATSFKPLPKIISVSPGFGRRGTVVTITGTNLVGVTSVKFGKVPASFAATGTPATSLTATVPANFTAGNVSVTTPYGTAVSPLAFVAKWKVVPKPPGPRDQP